MADETTPTPAPAADATPVAAASQDDIAKNKGIAAVTYIIFFLPYLVAKDSKFAMYHANQALLLLIFSVAISILGTIIPILGWFLILPLGELAVLILFIIGIIHALNGQEKPLPVIGGYTILK